MNQPPGKPKYTAEELERYFKDPEFRRQKAQPAERRPRVTKRLRIALIIGTALVAIVASYGVYLFSGLPTLERIENPKPDLATKVFSIDGEVLGQYYIENRSKVPISMIPDHVIKALIATEDRNFYDHWGVDAFRFIKGITKTVFSLFQRPEGASTITQQLSRSLYLGMNDRHVFDTITRKLREFITAIQLERSFTKEEILEFYLNVVYFGRGTYGIAAASQVYYGKSPSDLTLSEGAMLIAMLRGPAYYDPRNHPERAVARRNLVLGQMLKYGFITPEVAAAAREEELETRTAEELASTGIAPHFVEYIRHQLSEKADKAGFDIYKDGLSVYTTLDSRMQVHANRAVEEHLAEYQELFNGMWDWRRERDAFAQMVDHYIKVSAAYRNAPRAERDSIYESLKANRAWVDSIADIAKRIEVGFVALDPKTGQILAMVGGSNFRSFRYGLNHVTQIRRQPGSAFKPFVFTVAIDNGYPPTYELLNQPVTLMMADGKRWSPSNSDGQFGGKSTIREALRKSINLVAVRAIMEIAPVNLVVDYAKRMGIESPLPHVESLALGSGEVSPMEMASAFSVFANHGVHVEPISILRIEDKDGNVIEENMPVQREVFSDETAFIMTSMLEDVVNRGTGIRVRDYFQFPAAGKTGTTNDFGDAWFIGYTPSISASVWVGFDVQSVHFTTWDGQGGRAAAPIWGRFMKYVYEDPSINMPLEYFEKPASLYADSICVETKKLATQYCPLKALEYFTAKTRPGKCDKHSSELWKEGDDSGGTISF
jgi:penicillin-binding protein 1A